VGCNRANVDGTVNILVAARDANVKRVVYAASSSAYSLLNAKGMGWEHYAPSPGSIWTGPNAIQHMCGPNAPPPNETKCEGSDWVNNVVLQSPQNPAPILTDISNNNFRP
jgi:nucleoside-diphosphate-sugar epimerase